jgi:hypothetical protein
VSTISTTEAAAPTAEPFVRFAAFRGKVPLPWVTVAVLAILMAAGDGFILTSLQGAVGAIERSQGPFASWARDTAIVLPLFVLAVMWAFTRAHRKHGLASASFRKPRKMLTTALLIAAAGSVVGIGETVASAGYDYHLQSNLLQKTSTLHNHSIGTSAGTTANPDYTGSGWTPEQRQTMALDVKAAAYGSGILVIANLVLVGWVVALRGGRLDVVPARRRRRATEAKASATSVSPATA